MPDQVPQTTHSESLREDIEAEIYRLLNEREDTGKRVSRKSVVRTLDNIEAEYQKQREALLDELHDSIMRGELKLGNEQDPAFNYARIHRWLTAHRQDSKKGEK